MRVYLAPPEELRRKWKVQRDCSRRGYTTDQVLAELDRREPDSEAFIRPQQRYADIVVSFLPSARGDQEHLDAELVLRPTLKHPDLRSVLDGEADAAGGIKLTESGGEVHLLIPGRLERERAEAIEETIWERLHFASHLRTERLGEFTIGTDLHRSESLALIQLLILYHLFTATASVALGGVGRALCRPPKSPRPRSVLDGVYVGRGFGPVVEHVRELQPLVDARSRRGRSRPRARRRRRGSTRSR